MRPGVSREIDAPAHVVWDLLTDTDRWPAWGPSVRSASIDDGAFQRGATGAVTTAIGMTLPFEITAFDAGVCWSWRVRGVPATDHRVEPLGPRRCRVRFTVPWPAAPYLAVCRIGLGRLGRLAAGSGDGPTP